MAARTRLEKAADIAFRRLETVGRQTNHLPVEVRTLILIYTAQGIIDNGGLQYFFESNFEDAQPYEAFSDAYRVIGATTAADCLDKAIGLFPFAQPHLDAERRNAVLETLRRDGDSEFAKLDLQLCGDKHVWECLSQYVDAHRVALGV